MLCLIGAAACLIVYNYEDITMAGRKELIQQLSFVKEPLNHISLDMIYIMGGNSISLNHKFKIVAEYYKKEKCKNIWIFKRQGITEYSPSLKRNLKKNEWAALLLHKYGVPDENICFIESPDRFFGTLSEAETISKLISDSHFSNTLIITQPHHTKRTYFSFKKFLKNSEVSLYIVGSSEPVPLGECVIETIKYIIYQSFLI